MADEEDINVVVAADAMSVPDVVNEADAARVLAGATNGWPGFAAEGIIMIKAKLQKQKGTRDWNIVLNFGKTMPAPGLD